MVIDLHPPGRDSGEGAFALAAGAIVFALVLSAAILSVSGNVSMGLHETSLRLSEIASSVSSLNSPAGAPPGYALPSPSSPPSPGTRLSLPLLEGRPSMGNSSAGISLVEFSDFECPYCATFVSESLPGILPYVESGRVRLVFKQFPLDSACNPLLEVPFHADACAAAKASLCAFEQDRFWGMHDLLFAGQQNLSAPALEGFARILGLDMADFSDCLNSRDYSDYFSRDALDGEAAEVRGTPAFLVLLPSRLTQEKVSDIAAAAGRSAQQIAFLETEDGRTAVRISGALPPEVFAAVFDSA
ncbi:MAG: thioredoxin domain-containing protein [Candidatus Micrarchaeota archaeon]